MKNRIFLAAAGLLALALSSGAAHAAACANGSAGYNMKVSDGTTQCVAALTLSDGRIVQLQSPVDATGAAISPAIASLQTTGNNTLASILSAQATAALQGTANTSLASILSAVQAGNTAQATAAAQTTGNTSLATIAAASAAQATAAKQDTGNGSLATIATNTAGLATAAAQATLNAANGTPADAAYTGSNTATQIALLKALYGQAAPSGAVGATPASGAQFPWVQQAPGATFNVAGTLTTKSGTAMVSPSYRIPVSVSGNNAQVFATGAKQMLSATFCNKASSDRVVKFYDKATAPVPGTDTIVKSIFAPAGACPVIDFSSGGFPFANGLAVAIALPGDSDTGSSVAAGDISGLNIDHN